jgi:hypothetical protein
VISSVQQYRVGVRGQARPEVFTSGDYSGRGRYHAALSHGPRWPAGLWHGGERRILPIMP